MILETDLVEQAIDSSRRGTFIKEVVVTSSAVPIAMVRKRSAERADSRGVVMLVHGFGQNRYAWHMPQRSFANYLAADGWDVFNTDLRGHGRSRRLGKRRPRTLDDYIREDLPAAVTEAQRVSGAAQVFIVGHSMGGLVAYGAAATQLRGRIRGVASIGSPYQLARSVLVIRLLLAAGGAARFAGLLDRNVPVPLRMFGKQFRRQRMLLDTSTLPLPFRLWRPGAIEPSVLDTYLVRAFDWTSLGIATDFLRHALDSAIRSRDGVTDYGAAFELLDLPLLVIGGSHDQLAPPASVKPAWERSRAQDRTYREFPLGHLDLVIGREAPGTVWTTIRDWLRAR